jgi:preprotein translocase subunit SecD
VDGMTWFRLGSIAALYAGATYVLLPTILQEDPATRFDAQAGAVSVSRTTAPDLDLDVTFDGPSDAGAMAVTARLSAYAVAVDRVRGQAGGARVVLAPGTSRDAVRAALAAPGAVALYELGVVGAAVPAGEPVAVDPTLPPELGAALAAAGLDRTRAAAASVSALPTIERAVGPATGTASAPTMTVTPPFEAPTAVALALDGRIVAVGFGSDTLTLHAAGAAGDDPLAAAFPTLQGGPLPAGLTVEADPVVEDDAPAEDAEVAEAASSVPPWLKSILPDTRMNLGIDLQGGIDLTLQVELDAAVLAQAGRDAAFLKDNAAEDGVEVTNVEVDAVDPILLVESPAALADLTAWFARNMPDYEYAESPRTGVHAYQMTDARVTDVQTSSVDQVLETLRKRVDATGVKEPSIVKKSGGRISVQLPGEVDLEAAVAAIGTTAVLEFQLVDEAIGYSQISGMEAAAQAALPPDQYGVDKIVNQWLWRQGQLPNDRELVWQYEDTTDGHVRRRALAVHREVMLTGADINDAGVGWDNAQRPYVRLDLKPRGGQIFCRVTTDHVNENFAIVLDDEVMSAPNIRERICGGTASIEMGAGADALTEANNLALVLRTGSLDAPVSIGEVRTVGALLGADAIRSASIATLIGSTLVFVFMAVWYRTSGFLANIALLLNAMMVLATLALFGATLTLPGIAGIALTIGMAVDANIIVYERIREELRLGQNARKAVDAGFDKGLAAVLDSNITTAIAGVVLYSYGTGPIKGFAVTLLVGIGTTLVTAVWVSRILMEFATRSSTARLRI